MTAANVKVKPQATLKMKVTRKDGTVEYHEVPATVEHVGKPPKEK